MAGLLVGERVASTAVIMQPAPLFPAGHFCSLPFSLLASGHSGRLGALQALVDGGFLPWNRASDLGREGVTWVEAGQWKCCLHYTGWESQRGHKTPVWTVEEGIRSPTEEP